jgi:hypothetical protein
MIFLRQQPHEQHNHTDKRRYLNNQQFSARKPLWIFKVSWPQTRISKEAVRNEEGHATLTRTQDIALVLPVSQSGGKSKIINSVVNINKKMNAP